MCSVGEEGILRAINGRGQMGGTPPVVVGAVPHLQLVPL